MSEPEIATPEELDRFLEAHPEVSDADAVFVDLCGIVRGKRYPRAELPRLFEAGCPVPVSIYLLDVTGESADPGGRGFSDGDPDGVGWPLAGTLAPVPRADRPGAQVLMSAREPDGRPCLLEPRNLAARAVERFSELGLRIRLAFELEFHLLDPERDVRGRPRPPASSRGFGAGSTQVYGIAELDCFAGFFRELEAAARAQRIPATAASSEYAAGQYEVNLRHVDDPLAAADHCALFRHLVKSLARRHGIGATFMAKPFLEATGNGMHVHLSLFDAAGGNVFDDGSPEGSTILRHAIGGLLDTMYEALALFCPNVNALRRFGPNLFVPVNRSWGLNNRSVAVRVPVGRGASMRLEHRVAGADANPYLVLAALLAGIHHGLERRIDPGPAWTGNACEHPDPEMPRELPAAIERLRHGPILRGYLGARYLDLYCETKLREHGAFLRAISAREYEWYL